MNFKQRRELFEKKQQGGKGNLVYDGVCDDKHGEIDEYRYPNCVCGQNTKKSYKIINTKNKHVHWVGTCCINNYFDTNEFGGKYGIKQGSYVQLSESVDLIACKTRQKMKFNEIITNLKNKYIATDDDKKQIERLLGVKVRFVTNEHKNRERCDIHNAEMVEKEKKYEERHRKEVEEVIAFNFRNK